MATIFNLDPELVEQFQNQRVIVLEHNIIPEELGMGRDKDNDQEENEKM